MRSRHPCRPTGLLLDIACLVAMIAVSPGFSDALMAARQGSPSSAARLSMPAGALAKQDKAAGEPPGWYSWCVGYQMYPSDPGSMGQSPVGSPQLAAQCLGQRQVKAVIGGGAL